MHIALLFFSLIAIANFSGGLLSVISWIFVKRKYERVKIKKTGEKVSVIIPFKGKNYNNIKYFLNQNYENYEVIVVVDEESDARKFKEFDVNVIISRQIPTCSGKISALLTGIKFAKGSIYIFADGDIKPHKNWILYLVSSLNDKEIATSYRWYFKNAILSAWNMAAASILFYHVFNFAWGGSIAIRKKDFEKLGIKEIWKNEIVDDLTLTMVAKKNGYKINFVPQAISEADEEEKLNWMNKEMAWIKFYFPSLWLLAFFLNIGMRAAIISGFILIFFHPIIGFLLISPLIFDIARGWQEYDTFVRLMEYKKEKFMPSYVYAFLRPIVSFILSYNLIYSAFIKEIEWSGKKYKIARHKN